MQRSPTVLSACFHTRERICGLQCACRDRQAHWVGSRQISYPFRRISDTTQTSAVSGLCFLCFSGLVCLSFVSECCFRLCFMCLSESFLAWMLFLLLLAVSVALLLWLRGCCFCCFTGFTGFASECCWLFLLLYRLFEGMCQIHVSNSGCVAGFRRLCV